MARQTRSVLSQPIRRGRATSTSRAITDSLTTFRQPIRPPWGGYTPDVNPLILNPSAFASIIGLVFRGELLVTPDGWAQVISADMPLGETWVQGSGASTAQPIIRIDNFRRISATTITDDLMEFTGVDAGTNNHLFRTRSTRAEISHTSLTNSGGQPTGADDFLPDSTTFPLGAPNNSVAAEPLWVLCSLAMNVQFYPDSTGGSAYGDLIEVFRAGDGAAGAAVYPNNPQNFRARSCASWKERVWFLNTVEGASSTAHTQRLRRSIRADGVDLEGVGAGARDMGEFKGQGVAVRGMGERLAIYMEDGVAFGIHTGDENNPLHIELVSGGDTGIDNRGLLGTHAVTPVGHDRHFGIFTDGWFILDARKRWQEVGVVDADGVQVPRWRETFYSQLNQDAIDQIYVQFNPFRNEVIVAAPTGDSTTPDAIWRCDLRGDRVTLDPWSSVGGDDMSPRCLGTVRRTLSAALAWNDTTFNVPWPTVTQPWVAFAARQAENVIVHGTTGGYILAHDPTLTSRTGTDADSPEIPPWSVRTAEIPLDQDPISIKTIAELWMHYTNVGVSDITASMTARSNGLPGDERALTQSQSFNLDIGLGGSRQNVHGGYMLPGVYHALEAAGAGPAILLGWDIVFHRGEQRGQRDIAG